ncbi:two-component system response regulator [[Phormidium ambiguum] IAM M-71]|uniref:Two-component system response regulator n=1 Tax=[Phormidium ambiguum] IAM M-71 TaxID=454136 RepID=A0A1U7IK81_9CYAN|nr:response regulator [Phormidium ambiguum]OKH37627.1 two-component system response regulator [Phormidium ambiguum IAM M-71]
MSIKSILLIDDEKRLSIVIQMCLQKLGGWRVVTAESGKEGLSKAETEKPDAILLDLMMPDMDGITVLGKLQANPNTAEIPVILLTAKVQSANQHEYTQLKIAGLIAKPFDPLKLASQVAQTLGWE